MKTIWITLPTDSIIRLRNLDTLRSKRKEATYIGNDFIENHDVIAQIGQDTQRRNSQKSRMHKHPSTASLC